MEKRKFFRKKGLFWLGLFCIVGRFVFSAEEVMMENYKVNFRRQILYRDKCALELGYISLFTRETPEKNKYVVSDYTFDPRRLEEREGYKEYNYSRTWEELGFSCEANTKLYPTKVVYTISYKFSKEWTGGLYINPWIDDNLILGSRYRVVDIDGLTDGGIVEASDKKYVTIPRGRYTFQQIDIFPKEGGQITYRLKNEHPSVQHECLWVDLIGPEGKLNPTGIRLRLVQIPPEDKFPAGYSNKITLEVEFK